MTLEADRIYKYICMTVGGSLKTSDRLSLSEVTRRVATVDRSEILFLNVAKIVGEFDVKRGSELWVAVDLDAENAQ